MNLNEPKKFNIIVLVILAKKCIEVNRGNYFSEIISDNSKSNIKHNVGTYIQMKLMNIITLVYSSQIIRILLIQQFLNN